jgi:leucyl-tRNA synthetase
MKNDEVFICSERSALNMAYQGLTKEEEKVEILDVFKGEELMGLPLCAPNAVHKRVYVLPMMTISMKKGTGVVTCVPSDAPDDWMATCDLRNKKPLREKYGITEEMVNL